MKLHSRRQFVLGGATGLGLAFLGSQLPFMRHALAGVEQEPHFLLHLRVNGAWDTTLATSPFVPSKLRARGIDDQDYFYLYDDESLVNRNGILLGPSAAPIADYVDDIAFVNGMMMMADNFVHEPNRAYASSGSTKASDEFMAIQFARALGDAPLGVAHQLEYEQIQTGNYKPTTRIDELLSKSGAVGAEDFGIDLLRLKGEDDDVPSPLRTTQLIAVQSAESIKRMAELEAKYLALTNAESVRMRAMARVMAGFAAGTVRYAVYDICADSSLDTHFGHKMKHPENLKTAFTDIASTIKLLKAIEYRPFEGASGSSLFDYTTIVVTSEFARTPYKQNGSTADTAGTDHNPLNNSAMVLGKNIKGGQVIGSSRVWSRNETVEKRSRLQAQLFDFDAGRTATYEQTKAVISKVINPGQCIEGSKNACIDYIYPETLWKTIAQGFGLKGGTPNVAAALSIPGLLKI